MKTQRMEEEILRSIDNLLQNIAFSVNRRSKINDTSFNTYLEQALIDILNICFKGDFKPNKKSNEAAIDLGDTKKKISIQVTSRNTTTKISETFMTFFKNKKDLEFDKIKFFFLVQDDSVIKNININKIEKFLNSHDNLKIINKDRKHQIQVEITPALFSAEDDVHSFNYIRQNFHEIGFDNLLIIEERLNHIWPYLKISPDDIRKTIIDNQFTSINEIVETLSVTEAINHINNIFEPVKVLPHFILLNLNFAGELFGRYIEDMTLHTSNRNLFQSIGKELKSDGEKPVVDFLIFNNIQTVVFENTPEAIYHPEYSPNIITIFEKYDECEFDNSYIFNGPNEKLKNVSLNELFTQAYFYVQYGKYYEAVVIFKHIYELSKGGKNIAHFLCLYNLNRLQRQIRLNSDDIDVQTLYGGDLHKEVNSDISKIFTHDITKEELYLINYISNFRQVHDQSELLSIINKSDNVIHLDDIGYPYFDIRSVNYEWYEILNNKINFISYNRIVSELQYLDVKQLFTYMFKSILELCKFKSPTIRLGINIWVLKMSLIHTYSNELQRILNRYKFSSNRIKEPKLIKNFADHIIKVLSNIEKNEKALSEYFNINDDLVPLKTRINDIYSNICIHLLYLNFEEDDLNMCLDHLFKIDINNNIIIPNSYNYLVELFNIKQSKINQSNTDKFHEIYKKYYYAMDQLNQYSEGFISRDEVNEMDYVEVGLDDLVDLWEHRKKDINIERVKGTYVSKITKRFSMEYYRLGVIIGILEHDMFLPAAISSLEVTLNKNRNSFKWEFQKFIEVAYHADINLDGDDFKFLHEIKNDYIYWLLNLERFDYDRFEPYWLLEWGAPAYFNKFKTIDKLKTKLEEYLAKNDHPTMSRIYFNYFCK